MAITSEIQKKYGNTERNTGASYYTLYRGESTDTKPKFAQPGDVFEEYGTGKVYVASRDGKNRTVWTEDASAKRQTESGQTGLPTVSGADNGKVLKVAEGTWALGADNGLPVGFPEAGLTNAGKFLGFNDTTGAYEAKSAPSGGGAEKYVVTLTADDSGAETVWTADKTVAEVTAAYEAEKIVVALRKAHEPIAADVEIPLNYAVDMTDVSGCVFCGVTDTNVAKYIVSALGMNQGSDVWQVTVTPIPTSSNAPLIVTLTQDQNDSDTYNGDKMFSEVYNAYIAGRKVLYSLTIGTITKYGDVFYAYRDTNEPSEEYKLTIYLNGDNVNGSGAANDNVSFTEK